MIFDRDVHVLGIRSKTQLTPRALRAAKALLAVGCYCIGTNQVDLQCAAELGIAVFNSPFSNSRSVAELVIAEIIALARQLGDRSNEYDWCKYEKHGYYANRLSTGYTAANGEKSAKDAGKFAVKR